MIRDEIYAAILEAFRKSCGCPLDEAHAKLAADAIWELR